jgi:hypothetical protein
MGPGEFLGCVGGAAHTTFDLSRTGIPLWWRIKMVFFVAGISLARRRKCP